MNMAYLFRYNVERHFTILLQVRSCYCVIQNVNKLFGCLKKFSFENKNIAKIVVNLGPVS